MSERGYDNWTLGDRQHWRIETDASGLLARVWLVDADGSETQLQNVYAIELSADANRRNEHQKPLQLVIRVAGDVQITAAIGTVALEPMNLSAEEPS